MSVGDPGPYMELDGPRVWVPRTVPYLRARQLAREAITVYGDRLRYRGRCDARLIGFLVDCRCEEVCEAEPLCPEVPTWMFTIEEEL
jgi:hypothetical protein